MELAAAPTAAGRSPLQRRLRSLAGRAPYPLHSVCTIRVAGIGDIGALERAAARLLAAHPGVSVSLTDDGADAVTASLTAPAEVADAPALIGLGHDVVAEAAGVAAVSTPPLSHPEAARWLNDMAVLPAAASMREFWRARAAGWDAAPPPVGPADPGAAEPGRSSLRLDPALADRLAATREGLPAWLLAAWQVVQCRFTGADQVTVGSAVDLRRHPELAGCVGPLTTYLPLAHQELTHPLARLADGAATASATAAARAEWFSWDECVAHDRQDMALSAGFDVLTLPRWDFGAAAGAVSAVVVEADTRSEVFATRLAVRQSADGVDLVVEYDPRRVAAAAAADFPGTLVELISDALEHPDVPAESLRLVHHATAERIRTWSDATPAAGGRPLQETIGDWAACQPDAVAVVDGHMRVTYSEMSRSANRLARHLRGRGVGPDSLVGVFLPRGGELVTAMLGIATAGAAYVPLDPNHPDDRIAALIDEAGLSLIVTDELSAFRLSGDVDAVLLADADAEDGTAPPACHQPGNLLYVLHTSGSTGRPKGVMVTHDSVVELLKGAQAVLRPIPGDVWSQFHAITFDMAAWEIWGALTNGGRLVIVPREQARSPEAFYHLLDAEEVTVVAQTPTAFRGLTAVATERGLPSSVRLIVFGGEALRPADTRLWLEGNRIRLVNMYGITETTVHATWHDMSMQDLATPAVSPIGVPLPGRAVEVRDRSGAEVPVGFAGELFEGGVGLARGYLRQPGLTAERFVPDPRRPGQRLYRSGDVVRWGASGQLEYLGRADHQIKIRGVRVEPGEVEACVLSHPGVRECSVVAREGATGTRLLAYVVLDGVNAADVREYVASRLPAYLVPALFVPIPALPITENGKVDRAALPEPEAARDSVETPYREPNSDVERTLAEVWAETLRLQRVGVDDNYFSLGGDSILSILITSRLAQRGLRLELQHFFEHQTVAAMAAVAVPIASRTVGVVSAGEGALTPVQHWFLGQHQPRPGHWNQSWWFDAAEVDRELLEAATAAVLAHHPALRTRLLPRAADGRGPASTTASEGAPAAFVHVPIGDDWEDGLGRAAGELVEIDLTAGPVWRVALLDGGRPERRRVLMVAHHFVIDVVSWHIVLEDLQTAYRQLASGAPVELPAAGMAPEDWAATLAVQGPEVLDELEYWKRQSPAALPPLPLDQPATGPVRHADRRSVRRTLDAGRTRTLLRDMPASSRTRTDDVLLAAVARAIGDWTGHPDVHIAVEGQGRTGGLATGADLARSVGWFTTIGPLLLRLPDRSEPADLLAAVATRLHDFRHRALGYGILRYLLPEDHGARKELAELPSPQVVFNFVGRGDMTGGSRPEEGEAFRLRPIEDSRGSDHHPDNVWPHLLDVGVQVNDDVLTITLHYGQKHHDSATAHMLADDILRHLEQLIDSCDAGRAYTPADFPLVATDQAGLDDLLRRAAAAAPHASLPGPGPA